MKNNIFVATVFAFFILILTACQQNPTLPTKPETPQVNVPDFNADSTYSFTEKQVSFGPRVTGSEAHRKCGDWAVAKFKEYGCKVIEQPFDARIYDGSVKKARNITAQINPEASMRIFISAHWDSRNIAEEDKDPAKQKQAILGADDGATGVATLIEIARILQANPLAKNLGVDLVMFDAEDLGKNDDETGKSWGLGSQHWAGNPPVPNYQARYGILLDMVGAKNAIFPKEAFSQKYAPEIQDKIWQIAHEVGYSGFFSMDKCNGVTDDHFFVNDIGKIPTIDIINLDLSPGNGGYRFGAYHHTHDDNMSIVDKSTLKAVGQTLLHVIFRESVSPL